MSLLDYLSVDGNEIDELKEHLKVHFDPKQMFAWSTNFCDWEISFYLDVITNELKVMWRLALALCHDPLRLK